MYLDNEFIINILNDLNTLSGHSKNYSYTIELQCTLLVIGVVD